METPASHCKISERTCFFISPDVSRVEDQDSTAGITVTAAGKRMYPMPLKIPKSRMMLRYIRNKWKETDNGRQSKSQHYGNPYNRYSPYDDFLMIFAVFKQFEKVQNICICVSRSYGKKDSRNRAGYGKKVEHGTVPSPPYSKAAHRHGKAAEYAATNAVSVE